MTEESTTTKIEETTTPAKEPETHGPDELVFKNQIISIPINDLKTANYRDIGDISDLQRSIASVGLLQPISVYKTGRGEYTIIGGERRYTACKKLGYKEIKAIVYDNIDAIEVKKVILNEVTKQHTTFELAFKIKDLVEINGISLDKISDYIGRSYALVTKYYSIVKNYNAPLFAYISGKTLYIDTDGQYLTDRDFVSQNISLDTIANLQRIKPRKTQPLNSAEPLSKLLSEILEDKDKIKRYNEFIIFLIKKTKYGNIEKLVNDFRKELLNIEKEEMKPKEHDELLMTHIMKFFRWFQHYSSKELEERINKGLKELYPDKHYTITIKDK